jgi:hypothetical protein
MLDLVWVTPAAEGSAPPCSRLLVLELPRNWMAGDAVAVLLTGSRSGAMAARPVAAALLAEQAGVLHYPSGPAEACPNRDVDQVAEVLGALRTLQTRRDAGVVVAVGFGEAGPAALAAAREEVALRHLGAGGPRLAAAAARDAAGGWTFRAGATPPPSAEQWQARVPYLCAALAGRDGARTEAACRAALGGVPMGIVSPLPPRR